MAAFSVLPSQHEATQLPGAALMQPAHRDDATQHAPAKGVPAWMSELHPADPGPRFDPLVAHPARVYAYWLGGKDHYLADRQAAEEVIRWRPQVVAGARANRAFLSRVVRYLAAERGIRQFLDIGTGLPAPGSTHQVAQAITPEARIVYVDNDPLVLVHARALLTSTQAVPVTISTRTCVTPRPSAPRPPRPSTSPSLPRSCCWRSCISSPTPTTRTHSHVTGLFGGLPLVPPGVVPVSEWRPAIAPAAGQAADIYGGVARIPGARM